MLYCDAEWDQLWEHEITAGQQNGFAISLRLSYTPFTLLPVPRHENSKTTLTYAILSDIIETISLSTSSSPRPRSLFFNNCVTNFPTHKPQFWNLLTVSHNGTSADFKAHTTAQDTLKTTDPQDTRFSKFNFTSSIREAISGQLDQEIWGIRILHLCPSGLWGCKSFVLSTHWSSEKRSIYWTMKLGSV